MREQLTNTPKEIIVIDDDAAFLDIVLTFLFAAYGYSFSPHIKSFSDPLEGMAYIRNSNPNDPSLLISDVMMRLPGDVLAQNVSTIRPKMKILLISSADTPIPPSSAPLLGRNMLSEKFNFMSKSDFPSLLVPFLKSLQWQ